MRYVAIGDSFTEGVGDERPDGSLRGWADLVAAGLAASLAETGESVEYANLAVRGRLLAPILGEQLDAALALQPKPTLLSFNGGGNDMMRPSMEVHTLADLTGAAIDRCLDAGVHVLLISGADPTAGLPFGKVVHRRGIELTDAIRHFGDLEGVTFVDAFTDERLRQPHLWSADRLHLNSVGHRLVAEKILAALGHSSSAPTVVDPPRAEPSSRRDEARYWREHVLPWAWRRLRGRSSGDHRTAKVPVWQAVPAEITRHSER